MHRLTLGALLAALLLSRTASAFQSRGPPVSRSPRPRPRSRTAAAGGAVSLDDDNAEVDARPSPPAVLLAAAVALSCLCGGAAPATADEEAAAGRAAKIFNELTRIRVDENDADRQTTSALGRGIGDYFGKATARPDYGAVPRPFTDADDRAARNRAYDEAFQADARERDAYYGRMAMAKREQRAVEVSENRMGLGLDGPGDVRPRVGDEVVAGTASLRQYLLQQDPSTLTPAELKVYDQMKERVSEKESSGEEL